MRWGNFTAIQTVLINALAWAVIQVSVGLVIARVPLKNFNPEMWIFRIWPWESRRLYERVLLIQKWKPLLPDGARLSRKGFRKRSLANKDPAYLERFRIETIRAEATHWLAIPPFLLFFLWNIPSVAVWMPVYAIVINMPCIAVQRYNRIRIERVLARASQRAPLHLPASSA